MTTPTEEFRQMAEKSKMSTRVMKAVRVEAEEKWPTMVKRTVLGLAFIAFGGVGAVQLAWPWYVAAGFTLMGATIWSTQLVVGALKALLEPVRAYRALAGKDDA